MRHEALNLAAEWKLPVVFVLRITIGQFPFQKVSTSVRDNSPRAAAYGIPGERVEGNDVEKIYEATKRAVDRARAGGGPTLLEIHTVRLWGHFEGDARAYRGTELAEAEAKDPIPLMKQN